MIELIVEEDWVYNVAKMMRLDKSDEMRERYELLLGDMLCSDPKHEDYPNVVHSDEKGKLTSVKVCCKDFEKVIRETITGK